MSRKHSQFTINVLQFLKKRGKMRIDVLSSNYQGNNRKKVYDSLYRLIEQGYVDETVDKVGKYVELSPHGDRLVHNLQPKKDGVWKMVIFDIPEKNRKIRNLIRAKLVQLGFKKWQDSIWISPFELHPEIEKELRELADVYFVRLIKIQSINKTDDLDNLFK